MKWKNIDIGATYYYITGTFIEWSALFRSKQVREIVCEEVERAMRELVVHPGDWQFCASAQASCNVAAHASA